MDPGPSFSSFALNLNSPAVTRNLVILKSFLLVNRSTKKRVNPAFLLAGLSCVVATILLSTYCLLDPNSLTNYILYITKMFKIYFSISFLIYGPFIM